MNIPHKVCLNRHKVHMAEPVVWGLVLPLFWH